MDLSDFLIFKAAPNYDVFVNDETTFSNYYINQVYEKLKCLKFLDFSESTFIYPSNYQEDFVQASRRTNFKVNEWLIAAVKVDLNDQICSVLMIYKNHIKEGIVIDFQLLKITDIFYRGFKIQESVESNLIEDEIFLESLGYDEPDLNYTFYNFDESPDFDNSEVEEIQNIFVKTPEFEANQKKKIINLGSSNIVIEDNEDSDEIVIEINKPQFESTHKQKIKNLGFSGENRRPINKDKHANCVNIDVPVFEPTKNKKVLNLGHSNIDSIKRAKLDNKKPNIDNGPEEDVKPQFVPESKQKILNYDEIVKKENRNWQTIDLYKLKPNVYAGERTIINCNLFSKEIELVNKAYRALSTTRSLNYDSDCVFVNPKKDFLYDKDPTLTNFDIDKFKIILCVVDSLDNVIETIISDLTNSNNVFVVKMGEPNTILVSSTIGISLDDRALPYLTFVQLMEMVNND